MSERGATVTVDKELALEVLDVLATYLEEAGPCDHSVNICVCSIGRTWEEFALAVTGGKRCDVCRAPLSHPDAEQCGACRTSE